MYKTERTVYASHCGFDRKIKLNEMMGFLNDCEQYHLDKDKSVVDFFKKTGIGFYMVYRQADFFRYPKFNEKLEVFTHIYEMNSVAGFRNTAICDIDGNFVAKSYAMGAFVELKTQTLTRADTKFWDGYMYDEKLDMEYTNRRVILPKGLSFEQCADMKVPRDYIDFYNHVNNAKYVNIASEILPDNFNVGRLRIEYLRSAKRGDAIIAKIAESREDNCYYVVLENEVNVP